MLGQGLQQAMGYCNYCGSRGCQPHGRCMQNYFNQNDYPPRLPLQMVSISDNIPSKSSKSKKLLLLRK